MKVSYIFHIFNLVTEYLPCDRKVAFFIACQSALETGYGKSDIYNIAHNAFGMRRVYSRISTSYESYHKHQKYVSLIFSVIDYMLWLEMSGFTYEHLYDFEKFVVKMNLSSYNPSDTYVSKILQIFKKYYHE